MSPVARIRTTAPGLSVAGVEIVGAADVLDACVELLGADPLGVGAPVVVELEFEVVEEGVVSAGAVEEGAVAIEVSDWLVSADDEAKPSVVGGVFVVVSAIPKGA